MSSFDHSEDDDICVVCNKVLYFYEECGEHAGLHRKCCDDPSCEHNQEGWNEEDEIADLKSMESECSNFTSKGRCRDCNEIEVICDYCSCCMECCQCADSFND